jgi:hypothetical protein
MGFLAGSTLYGGVVNGFDNSIAGSGLGAPALSGYVGATIATPVTGLRVGTAFDILNVNTMPFNTKVEGEMWALAGYASFQATEKLSLHGRFEWAAGEVDNPNYARGTLPPGTIYGDLLGNGIYATTVTAQYDLWKNVISRIEFRWDHAEHGDLFGGNTPGVPNRADAYLLAANVIYKF